MMAAAPTALVVDDEDDIREVTRLSLQVYAGWRVLEAPDGPSALDLARTQRPDVVLLDMMMPGMDGLTTLAHLKASAETADIPVILLTAKSQVGTTQPWRDEPVHGVIPKPFGAKTLAAQVAQILGWPVPSRPARGA